MIWLFDLDNTLYPYSSGVYQHINLLMNQYIESFLQIPLEEVDQIRKKYIKEYGTTLLGMVIHHHVDPDDFLHKIHSFSLHKFLKKEPDLIELLRSLPGEKYIFTNSPAFYAKKVLDILGIDIFFQSLFSIENFDYYGKPNPSAYQKVIQSLKPSDSIHFVDDEPFNIETAKKFGFFTYLVDSKRPGLDNYYQDELIPVLKGLK